MSEQAEIVSTLGPEAFTGDMLLLRMADHFYWVGEFERLLDEIKRNMDAAMQKIGEALMPIFEKFAHDMAGIL